MGLLEPITHKEEIESLLNEAQSMYDNAKNKFESQKKQTTKRLENLGKVKVNAWTEGMDSFVTAFGTFKNVEMDRRIDSNMDFIGSDEEPKQMLMNIQNASMTANEVAKAGFAALGTGALVGIASYGGAMMFGTASTGTAIAALSGAAKTNATLAWFGGGAKAAGGLGMAGGKLILAGVVVAPIVAVAAVIAGAKGKEKLAEAKKIHAEAEEAVSQMNIMDRLIRKDEHYNADGSMLKEAKKLAKNRAESQDIHAGDFRDVHEHLTDELHYGDATSGGTTFEEVQMAYETPEKYAKAFERKAVKVEMKCTAVNMAKASFVTTGIVSGVTNMFEVFQDKKELDAALHDVGADAIKGAARGGATGIVSTAIRYKGIKAGSALLSDSVAATVMAGGIIDGGVALYSYARGEIDEQQLKEQLVDTTAKAATTIYFTKAVGTIMGLR